MRAGCSRAGTASALPEVVAALLESDAALRGRPERVSGDSADDGRAAAESALLALTTLLDEAHHRPLAGLKKGGIGARERARLSGKVGIAEPALWIDVADAAGLLTRHGSGYGAADEYRPGARSSRPAVGRRRAQLVRPRPRIDEQGDRRRRGGAPAADGVGRRDRAPGTATAAAVSGRPGPPQPNRLFCPLHPTRRGSAADGLRGPARGCAPRRRRRDRLTALGEHLVPRRPSDAVKRSPQPSRNCCPRRGPARAASDLTAIVSGHRALRRPGCSRRPRRGARGVATTWTSPPPASAPRSTWADRQDPRGRAHRGDRQAAPQPLDYLLADVARRHGTVGGGVRGAASAARADVAEMLATRSLQTLHLSRVAPTVLVAPSNWMGGLAAA